MTLENLEKCTFVSPHENLFAKIAQELDKLSQASPLEAAKAIFFFPTKRLIRLFQSYLLKQNPERALILPRCYAFNEFWQLPSLTSLPQPYSDWALKTQYVAHVQACLKKQSINLSFSEVYARALALLDFKEVLDQDLAPWPIKEDMWQMAPSAEGWQLLTQGLENLPSKASFLNQALDTLEILWEKNPWQAPLYAFGVVPETAHDRRLLALILRQPQGHLYFWACPPGREVLPLSHPQAGLKPYAKAVASEEKEEKELDIPSSASQFIYGVFSSCPSLSFQPLSGSLQLYACQDLLEEAKLISWAIKQVIVETDQEVALITSHKGLRNLVRLYSRQQGIEIDDAAGLSLLETKGGGPGGTAFKMVE